MTRTATRAVDDGFILTAQPKELQAFVGKYADDEKAWKGSSAMTRRASESDEAPLAVTNAPGGEAVVPGEVEERHTTHATNAPLHLAIGDYAIKSGPRGHASKSGSLRAARIR